MAHAPQPEVSGSPIIETEFYAAPGIFPVDGWTLFEGPEPDSEGFNRYRFSARRGAVEQRLDVSGLCFTPTQERFSWLVRNGFPTAPGVGAWSSADVDAQLALDRAVLAA